MSVVAATVNTLKLSCVEVSYGIVPYPTLCWCIYPKNCLSLQMGDDFKTEDPKRGSLFIQTSYKHNVFYSYLVRFATSL